jgi:hypothetical protein
MSDKLHSTYAHVPILVKDNYSVWALKVKAYLALNNHVCVIWCQVLTDGTQGDPTPPEDANNFQRWNKSKRVALGLIISTATDLNFKLCHAHETGRTWDLWHTIKDCHVLQDVSLWYEAWMMLFAVHKTPDEPYCNIYSEGVSLICFLSVCGYVTTINGILFIPSLASSLFSPNQFAQDHRTTHSEVTDYLI